ncbi:gamma-type small acid-soluble spore protein [Psychrobacillus sp. OK032]|uniref:gamma-type small acid-soluble spore protein n=1 Tax=Psychrobacillus sp. OK032 TaxID=1884358 RepID=UPI0008AF814D|nr:gamma-type small acid-soluble spore protein [Psychrobacillus sp. OK032]SES30867.1 hypothetical protein SAMN05518872_107231 [Psychrobacillus sp. OK032]
MEKKHTKFTVVGTDIEEVKRLNANSGMTYNELNEWFARKKNGDSMKSVNGTSISNNK